MDMEKKYYAFISYSRAEKDVAIDIHKNIEHYAYPKEWMQEENYPYDDKFVRPVFLDLTDLSARRRNFTEEIRERLNEARYLIVICTQNSAKSAYVKREIDYFLSTHNNNADLICAVYVDKIFNGMHPVIDEIVASRNCPIYVTSEGEAGMTGRKYCFHHILEFLLKVDFAKLYNRYEAYRRNKRVRRMKMAAMVLTSVFGVLTWALISQINRTQAERKQAELYERKAEFEQKTFPFSIVVGYVGNFLRPMVESLCEMGNEPDVLIYMPYSYDELSFRTRLKKYSNHLISNYGIDSTSLSRKNISVQSRHRDMTIVQIDFDSFSVYVDNATTVSAFKSVIDYKLSNKDIDWGLNQDQMVQFYTDAFIQCSLDSLGAVAPCVHFIRNTREMDSVLIDIKNR